MFFKLLASCLISILYHTIANILCRPPAKPLVLLYEYHSLTTNAAAKV